MLFNSIEFFIFLPIVFICYWFFFSKNINYRNLFLLVVSYVFYGWWDWKFLGLIFLSSLADYIIGQKLYSASNRTKKRYYLLTSLAINLGVLGFFKYFNFFIDNFIILLSEIGYQQDIATLNIILPVGISFYTFQTLSYTIDIYRNHLKPTNDPIQFFTFVSFFPQLVAGPIERAQNLLPQFSTLKQFDYNLAVDGLRQILWGFFKKVVIADNCATGVAYIFDNSEFLPGSTLVIGSVLFAFQIYGDFSGYSDIAIGVSKLFGFQLMQNFAFPYFSRNINEFWKRWHISLSSWFRDYVYIPLGGSRVSKIKHLTNLIITFTISGLWHGSNWTFIAWGFFNGLLYLPSVFSLRIFTLPNKYFEIPKILFTFSLTCLLWIFFRSDDLYSAFGYIAGIFNTSLFDIKFSAILTGKLQTNLYDLLFALIVLVLVEWFCRDKQFGLDIKEKSKYLQILIYSFVFYLVISMGGSQSEFIYFQF